MTDYKISVVVPFYNAEDTLELCLTALIKQNLKPEEIIVVDNNSNDRSKIIVDEFINNSKDSKIVYLECKKKGPSAARNKGASIAKGDWLIFTDSDCVPSPSWISDYKVHFHDETFGAVAGCIKPFLPTNPIQKTLSLFTLPENQQEIVHDNFTITEGLYPTANLAVKKKVFNRIGGFNENLNYSEDREFCYKIYKAGFKIKALKNASVEHIHRKSLKGLIKQSFFFGTGHPYNLRYLSQGIVILHLPFFNLHKTLPGKYVWIDLIQADKKLFLLCLLGLFWWPFYILIFAYFLILCRFIHKKASEKKIKTTFSELPSIAFFLILKSFFLTCGRISLSFKHRVICV